MNNDDINQKINAVKEKMVKQFNVLIKEQLDDLRMQLLDSAVTSNHISSINYEDNGENQENEPEKENIVHQDSNNSEDNGEEEIQEINNGEEEIQEINVHQNSNNNSTIKYHRKKTSCKRLHYGEMFPICDI